MPKPRTRPLERVVRPVASRRTTFRSRPGVVEFAMNASQSPEGDTLTWLSPSPWVTDAMNPVMTARLMRAGRLAHRSPFVRGLYLCGSATHPGQWLSFCAISGVLAADLVRRDLG